MEEAGRQVVEEAKAHALEITGQAERKCENLQKDYDRILLDVTGFKAEMMGMYRRHMELLAALPEKKMAQIEYEDEFREVPPEEVETEEAAEK